MAAPGSSSAEIAQAKAELRSEVLAERGRMSAGQLALAAHAIAGQVLDLPEVAGARCVAAYVSVGREPGTRHLLDRLVASDVLVLAPVLLADGDLDWAEYDGSDWVEPAARGLVEPTGPRLGVDAIRRADVVLAPALAVDRFGNRLGRGGGSYDRALARVERGVPVTALVYDEHLLQNRLIPTEVHDRRVDHAVTPIRTATFERATDRPDDQTAVAVEPS